MSLKLYFPFPLYVVFLCMLLPMQGNSQVVFAKDYLTQGFDNSIALTQSPTVLNARDSGYYLFGWNGDSSMGSDNHWLSLSRVSKKGELLWNKNSDIYSVDDNYGITGIGGVVQYPDSSFAMLWNDSYTYQAVQRPGLLHFDKNGNFIWGKKYIYPSNWRYPYINSIARTLDGGIIGWGNVVASSNSYYWVVLMKTDSSGNVQWCKRYLADSSYENPFERTRITLTQDSGYLVTFIKNDSATITSGTCLMKTDANGNPMWVKEYYPIGPLYTQPQVVNGSIYLAENNHILSDIMVIKTTMQGIPIWTYTYTNNNAEELYDGITLHNGSTLLAILNKDSTCSILKIDSSGNTVWASSYGAINFLTLTTLDITLDGGILGCGMDGPNNLYAPFYWQLLKTDAKGHDGCETPVTFTKTPTTITWKNTFCYVQNIAVTVKDTLLNFHYTALDTTTLCSVKPLAVNQVTETKAQVSLFPNPNNGAFTFSCHSEQGEESNATIEVYSELGQKVYSNSFLIPNSQFVINLSSQPNGIYLYRVLQQDGSLIGEGKLIIQK